MEVSDQTQVVDPENRYTNLSLLELDTRLRDLTNQRRRCRPDESFKVEKLSIEIDKVGEALDLKKAELKQHSAKS